MPKDKGTTLPITQLNGLMINYADKNSTFNMPNMNTAQRDKLENIELYTLNGSTYTVKPGTMIFNTDIGIPQIFQNGKWFNMQLSAAPGEGNVTTDVNAGMGVVGNVLTMANLDGATIGQSNFAASSVILNNNGANGTVILPTADNQLLVFSKANDGQTIIPAINPNKENKPVTLVDGALEAFKPLLKTHKKHRQKDNLLKDDFDIPVMALDGIDAVNFAGPVGIMTMNNGNTDLGFIALSVNPDDITQQNIVFTDNQDITEPSTYDAIVEINSQKGGLLLPRLSDDTINAMTNKVAGLTCYNTNINQQVVYNGAEWISGSGNVVGPSGDPASTLNAIATYADDTGQNLLNTGVTIDTSDNSMYLLGSNIASSIKISPSDAPYISVNLSIGTDSTDSTQAQLVTDSTSASVQALFNLDGSTTRAALVVNSSDEALLQLTPANGFNLKLLANTSMTQNTSYTFPQSLPISPTLDDGSTLNTVLSSDTDGNLSWEYSLPISIGPTTFNNIILPELNNIAQVNTYLQINPPNAPNYLVGSPTALLASPGVDYSIIPVTSLMTYAVSTNNNILAIGFVAYSSINIKDVLSRNDEFTDEAIELFSKIPLTKYRYKDILKNGNGIYYGVIAEELREVIPHIVNDSFEFIPNIMSIAEVNYEDSQNIIVFLKKNKELGDLVGKNIELYADSQRIRGMVTANNSETISIKLDKKYNKLDNIFIYGTFENCPNVNKDQLFEMNMVVTQNLIKRVAELEVKLGA